MSNSFKIGDTVKPKSDYPQEARGRNGFESIKGIIKGFDTATDRILPIIQNQDGDTYTVNPDIYEITEAK